MSVYQVVVEMKDGVSEPAKKMISTLGEGAESAELLGAALAGVGVAAAAVAAGFGALVVEGAKFAIEASQAKAQMLTMFDALGEGKITGEQVDNMLDGLSQRLGQTKDAMVPLVQKFAAMGITSEDALERMTTAALSAKALAGGAESGAQAFEALAKKIQVASETGEGLKIPTKGLGVLAEMGVTVNDVAAKMGVSAKVLGEQLKAGTANADKFGDALQSALIEKGAVPLEKMSLSAANLGGMLKQYVGDIFEDMSGAIEPFMKEVKGLFQIFDSKTKPSGEALKTGIEGFFKRVFAAATRVVPMVKHFLLDLVIYGLKAYIALKPIVKWFDQLASNKVIIDTITKGFTLLGYAVAGVAAIGVAFVALLGFLAYGFVAGATGIYDMGKALWSFIGGIGEFLAGAGAALAGWVASAATAAYDFVAGLIAGIGNGAGQVVGAVKGLADSATGAFKSALGIASPSKVMVAMGGDMTDGVVEGLDQGASDVHGAASGVASASVKGMAAPSISAGATGGKGETTINVAVQIDGAGKSALQITEEMVSSVFQRVALQAGV